MAWRSYESPLGRIAKVFDADIIRFAEPTPPNMKMMDLLDCLKQNEHRVGHWEYADAAETALALSQEIQNGLLIPVLLQRAYALAKARRLDDAIEVAQRILMLANDRPEGYVLMASVYLKKNWARNALMITRQGLKRVPTEHPFWTHLRARKEHVEKVIQNHNMRVLKRLPYDICFNIFSRLSFVDLLQCAQTCNSWFRFFMDFDAMWYILDFTGINMKALSLYDTNKVVSRVREVVFPTAQDNTMSGVLTFLVTQKVSDLQSIVFPQLTHKIAKSFKQFFPELIRMNKGSLSYLSLSMRSAAYTALLPPVLMQCRRLKVLHLVSDDTAFLRDEVIASLADLRLKCLSLWVGNAQKDKVIRVLQNCTDLKHIELNTWGYESNDFEELLNFIYQRFRGTLTELYLRHREKAEPVEGWHVNCEHNDGWHQDTGLRTLDVENTLVAGCRALTQFFELGHETLRKVRLPLRITSPSHEGWHVADTIGDFSNLRTLEIVPTNPVWKAPSVLAHVIGVCPNLEDVTINNIVVEKATLEKLTELKRLRRLRLLDNTRPELEDFKTFLSNSKGLRCLELCNISHTATRLKQVGLFNGFSTCQGLERLVLKKFDVDDAVLTALRRSNSIHTLTLSQLNGITKEVLDQFPHIKQIHIDSCKKITEQIVKDYMEKGAPCGMLLSYKAKAQNHKTTYFYKDANGKVTTGSSPDIKKYHLR